MRFGEPHLTLTLHIDMSGFSGDCANRQHSHDELRDFISTSSMSESLHLRMSSEISLPPIEAV
jgi:hypothetical protein